MARLFADVTIDGTVIPARVIAREAQNHPFPDGKPGRAWTAAARALAVRALLLDEARRRGLSPAPAAVGPGQLETEEEALIRQLLDEAIEIGEPDPADLRAAYAARPDRFRAPTLYEAAHILLVASPGDAAARAAARAAAERIQAALADDPGRFGDLARRHSACPSREQGGFLGQLNAGDTVPEFEAALAGMAEGTIAATPVETRYGIHVVRLDARAEGALLPFEAVAPRLRDAWRKTAWVRAARAFVAALAAEAQIGGVSLLSHADRG